MLLIDCINQFYAANKPDQTLAICSIKKDSVIDYTIYQGCGGHLVMYLRLYHFFQHLNENSQQKAFYATQFNSDEKVSVFFQITDPKKYLKDASILFDKITQLVIEEEKLNSKNTKITYMMGTVGIYTIGCELFYLLNDSKKFNWCLG